MPPPVLNKDDMWRRWQAGEFGNKPRVWLSLAELSASGYTGPVVVRYKAASAKWVAYHVPAAEVPDKVAEFVADGADPRLFAFNESVPDPLITLQGEYLRNPPSIPGQMPGQLHYSLVPGTHRGSLRDHGRHAGGLEAQGILRRWLDAPSYEWLMELSELYPDHVVEFSTFSRSLGDLRWNTVFWEVRLY
jgi:hypothetical protein